MIHEYSDIINTLRNEIKNRANEISHRLDSGEVEEIRELLGFIDDLEDKMSSFDDIVNFAWEDCEVF